MSLSAWVRQIHRWTSLVFAAAVLLVTFLVVTGSEEPAEWVYLLPLLPLGLLALTGVYLFALPYSARLRGRRDQGS